MVLPEESLLGLVTVAVVVVLLVEVHRLKQLWEVRVPVPEETVEDGGGVPAIVSFGKQKGAA